jgi:hypothetical protein
MDEKRMSIPALTAHCLQELDHYRKNEQYTEIYAIELLRRATTQGNQQARASVQFCFGGIVRDWFRCHPHREKACHLESEEYYIAQAFVSFWQATASYHRVEFSPLSDVLLYLRASLHGAIMDTLRAYEQPMGVPLPGQRKSRVDGSASSEAWNNLTMMLPSPLEQRLAYLLFHCGLKPREIVHVCPQEFSDVQEIYRLQYNITERLLCSANSLQ